MLFSVLDDQFEQSIPLIPVGQSIPRCLYQTYPDPAQLPAVLSANIRHLQRLNPDWQYRLFSDADINRFIAQEYPALVGYYAQISAAYGAAKADFFRYLLIYRYGGVYIDIKSTINKPLSSTIQPADRFLLSNWREWHAQAGYKGWGKYWELAHVEDGEFQQWHIVSVAGHPYLRAVILALLRNIKHYHPYWFGVGKLGVLRTTGPIAYTLAIAAVRAADQIDLVNIRADYGFEYSIFEKNGHLEVFSQHYSKTPLPIIQKSRTASALAFLVGALQKIARKIFKKIAHPKARP